MGLLGVLEVLVEAEFEPEMRGMLSISKTNLAKKSLAKFAKKYCKMKKILLRS